MTDKEFQKFWQNVLSMDVSPDFLEILLELKENQEEIRKIRQELKKLLS